MSFDLDSRLLIRGVNWLGDAVMTTPALLRLRERFPNTHIAILTPRKFADLYRHHPAIDAILTFDPEEAVTQIASRLRPHRFDTGLILPNSPRSALELWLARIPRRIGYSAWRRWLLTDPLPSRPGHIRMRKRPLAEIRTLTANDAPSAPNRPTLTPQAHQIHDYLHLAAVLGANPTPCPPRIFVTHDEVLAAQNRFSIESGAPGWLGLNAGAEYGPAKRWPADRFAATATALRRKTACHCLIFGGPNDLATARALADTIAASPIPGATSQPRVVNAAGQTSLRELAALLKLCRVLLTNDTGPMHLAAAVGTPVVVPFGSTSPNLTAPGLPGDPTHSLLCSNVPCAPCFLRTCPIDLRCLNSIQVDPVIDALLARLGPHTSVDPNLPPYGPSTG